MTETAKQSIGLLHISNVRLSYFYGHEPYIGKPTKEQPNPKPTYRSHFLMVPSHPDLPRIAQVIESVGAAYWKEQWPAIKEQLKGQDKLCLHRGDISQAGKPEYKGMFYLAGSNKRRFTIIDGDRTPLTAKDLRPYGGCWANAIVDIYAQGANSGFGTRINCTITGIQFLRHDEAFGGGAPPADPTEFGVVAASADAAPPAAGADPLAGIV